jgi:hypothetical protein
MELKSILLNQFLIEAKKKWNLNNYVWKMEFQKNGNVHFHILSDVWIPWLELRNCWNRIQNKLGYVDEFNKINPGKSPNGTDVHSLKKVDNVVAYVLKYMTKSDVKSSYTIKSSERPKLRRPNTLIIGLSRGVKLYLRSISNNGRIWTCSRSLSNIKGANIDLSDEFQEEIEKLQKMKGSRRFDRQYFSGILFQNSSITKKDFPLLYNLFHEYVLSIFPQRQKTIWNSE